MSIRTQNKYVKSFTKNYDVTKLGYYEIHRTILSAIQREKQIKGGSRKKKLDLIEKMNPKWEDLYESLI